MPHTTSRPTSDRLIRDTLVGQLKAKYKGDKETEVIQELGVIHGAARVDIAVVNGVIHGYELKSDLDTLYRLPGQVKLYGAVLDKMTLVVGGEHLFEAFHAVPEWWGITVARVQGANKVVLRSIREADQNDSQDPVSIARLLWREEALSLLENNDWAEGVRSKPREDVYNRLAERMSVGRLKDEVRTVLRSRINWRVATR